jgi:hypothetical protein
MTMRFVTMLLGLMLIALAGLWFFTPFLDSTYSRHVPGIAHSKSHSRAAAPGSAPGVQSRSATPSAPAASAPGAGQIGSKALADNFMSMVNVGTGILGAQIRQRRERD